MTKKATKKKPAPGVDQAARYVVTYVYYVDEQQHFDTATHEGTLTEFLLLLNQNFQRPSIVFSLKVTKAQFDELEAAMDAVEGDEAVVPIGGGYAARIVDEEEIDFDAAVRNNSPTSPASEDEGMRIRARDPDVFDDGDRDLDHDESGLDDSDLDGGGEFEDFDDDDDD